ncbi:Cytokinin oxidase [Alloactinosynnema sp. L-07]|uniref:FAD-binding protein n=1 Tax=Alloactinosynnema sp. L-07 TaxID=1653480 RepID=UPI00065F083D|nr:FAD-binding protein [Alloactinosynnema sp. L-07]CRK58648.1 Cytokinin oxidase [Alloactinosynnema sp. L-07]
MRESGLPGLNRRGFLAVGAATAVVAFDPAGLGWISQAQADEGATGTRVPPLDGELVTDDAALSEAAEDYGQIVHDRPRAVLRPGSVRDIQKIVRFACANGLSVAVRGQGHSVFGQAQVKAGVVIDSRTLARIHSVGRDRAVVDAGVTWSALFTAALAAGVTPPVATDYIGLSVGGTLSVGGIGGATSHHGLQVDTVLALEVVTGTGELVGCSRTENRDLFDVVLGGLGQYGLIVRATLRVIPAPATARVYRLSYTDLTDLTAAQRTALADGRFSYLEGQVAPTETGWGYVLEGVAYFSGQSPDDATLLRGLPAPAATDIAELPYFAWLDRLTALVDQLRPLRFPNPWLNLFLPDAVTDRYVADLLADLSPADVGGPILLYPVPRRRLTRPLVAVPDSDVVFLLSVLRVVAPPNPDTVNRLIADNRAAYVDAVALGATQYPIGAIPVSPAEWAAHYGAQYPRARRAKARFDPHGVLTPGQKIFP